MLLDSDLSKRLRSILFPRIFLDMHEESRQYSRDYYCTDKLDNYSSWKTFAFKILCHYCMVSWGIKHESK